MGGARFTYNPTGEQKKRCQRINRQRDDSANGGYEAPGEAYEGGNHAEDAGKYFVVGHRGRAAVVLRGDQVGGEGEDNEAAEELGWVS